MNVAEMCGIREKRCNFTDGVLVVDGEVLAPFSIAVRENYYHNATAASKGAHDAGMCLSLRNWPGSWPGSYTAPQKARCSAHATGRH